MTALKGIRVLDFGRYVAGPYCAALLADMGAEVIRVERPGGGEDRGLVPVADSADGAVFLQMNRNKRSFAFDPKAPAAAEIRRRLVESADIVIANVPKSSLEAMRLDYASLCAIRPDIILVNLSSFGAKGDWADLPGFDSIGQAMCGAAYLTGAGETPYRAPTTWVDHATAVYAAFGAVTALFERSRSGRGQVVEGSLLASAIAFSSTFLLEQALTRADRQPIGNRSYFNGPTDTFKTQDGWVLTQIITEPMFHRWAHMIGEPEWLNDPRFANDQLRGDNGAVLSARMAAWCSERTSVEALFELAKAKLPAGPVLTPQQALDHPQVQSLGIMTPLAVPGVGEQVPITRTPLDFSATPAQIRSAPPKPGAHTEEILAELGLQSETDVSSHFDFRV